MRRRVDVGLSKRILILERDNYTCQYCGARAPDVVLQVDHIVPVARGGTNRTTNLVAACIACNKGKCDKTVYPPNWHERELKVAEHEPRAVRPKYQCVDCGAKADTLHFVPWCVSTRGEEMRLVVACPRHDPGGYWLHISEVTKKPDRWLQHLSRKRDGIASVLLSQWLNA